MTSSPGAPAAVRPPQDRSALERRLLLHVAGTLDPEAFAEAFDPSQPSPAQTRALDIVATCLGALGVPLFVLLGLCEPEVLAS